MDEADYAETLSEEATSRGLYMPTLVSGSLIGCSPLTRGHWIM